MSRTLTDNNKTRVGISLQNNLRCFHQSLLSFIGPNHPDVYDHWCIFGKSHLAPKLHSIAAGIELRKIHAGTNHMDFIWRNPVFLAELLFNHSAIGHDFRAAALENEVPLPMSD